MNTQLSEEDQRELKETIKHLVRYLDSVDSICEDVRAGLLHVILLTIEDPNAEEEAKSVVYGLAEEYDKSATYLFGLIVKAITFCEEEMMKESVQKIVH